MNKINVISGGPNTGKTTTILELKRRGYNVLQECARKIANSKFIGKSIKEIKKKEFQDAIFDLQKERLEKLKGDKFFFTDRGLGDTLAYYRINNLEVPKEKWDYALRFRYSKIFILDFLNFYEQDSLRQETEQEQKKIQKIIIDIYKQLEYNIVIIPFMKVSERVDFILSKLKSK